MFCSGTFANKHGVYIAPDGRPVDRTGMPIGPPGTGLDSGGFIMDPEGNFYLPDGSSYPDKESIPEGMNFRALLAYSPSLCVAAAHGWAIAIDFQGKELKMR